MSDSATSAPSPKTGIDDYLSELKTRTDKVVSSSKELPKDIPFHRTLDRKFRTDLDASSARILKLTNRLLKLAQTVQSNQASKTSQVSQLAPTSKVVKNAKGKEREETVLRDEDDVVDKYHSIVVDVVDPLLEQVDYCLDVHTGQFKTEVKQTQPLQGITKIVEQSKNPLDNPNARLPQHILHAANIPKPQLRFLEKVNNSNDYVWTPSLKKKWNAVPETRIEVDGQDDDSNPPKSTHPYSHEIHNIQYPESLFTSRPPIPPRSFEDTPFTFINTLEGLDSLLDVLRQAKEIAIDLEHHSYRSFYGFLCLMQISTREGDWVIDCLVPEIRRDLQKFNEVFTDPSIIKVFHGAYSDIIWLQENFSIYVVNLFDTYHATHALDFQKHSLAFLLGIYCDFTADKRYQLADWRIRPLPEVMLHYARSDTHFLLFIYDNMRESLLEKASSSKPSPKPSSDQDQDTVMREPHSSGGTDIGDSKSNTALILRVLHDSEETCLREFSREVYNAETGEGLRGWGNLLIKWNKQSLLTDGVQRSVFLAVHKWRDSVARQEDESIVYVCPNQALLSLIERSVPEDLMALHASFQNYVPPLIRKRSMELLKILQEAAEEGTKLAELRAKERELARLDETEIEMAIAEAKEKEEKKSSHTFFASQPVPLPDLWSTSAAAQPSSSFAPVNTGTSLISSSSALLGQRPPKPVIAPSIPALSTKHSSLLAVNLLKDQNHSNMNLSNLDEKGKVQTRDVIAKIHSSILKSQQKKVTIQKKQPQQPTTATPGLISSTPSKATAAEPTSDSKPSDYSTTITSTTESLVKLPDELPFIPRSQRMAKQPDDQDIVIVGQRKQKRKRPDTTETGVTLEAEAGASAGSELGQRKKRGKDKQDKQDLIRKLAEPESEIPVFDYSTASNILDEGVESMKPEDSSRRKDRKKDKQGTKMDFREFGPAPKKTNEPKSGNKSTTFR